MYRKVVMSVVCVLGIMTLVVSAQQGPDAVPRPEPLNVDLVRPQIDFTNGRNFHLFGGPSGKEMELTHQSQELVKQLAKAEGENREKIRTKLSDTLGKQFDLRQKRHEAELTALEAQVKKLKDLVQKRQDNRREIISKRIEQLQRDADGLGW
jgi:hypothetical protein